MTVQGVRCVYFQTEIIALQKLLNKYRTTKE